MATGGTLFEELGFYYVGPIDGHNLDHLVPILENVRDMQDGPVLVHVVTQKGKGYAPAEAAADKGHGVVKFDVVSGKQHKAAANAPGGVPRAAMASASAATGRSPSTRRSSARPGPMSTTRPAGSGCRRAPPTAPSASRARRGT